MTFTLDSFYPDRLACDHGAILFAQLPSTTMTTRPPSTASPGPGGAPLAPWPSRGALSGWPCLPAWPVS
jgi:hypothetical protein